MRSSCILVLLFLYSNSQQPASFSLHNSFSTCYQVHNFMLGLNLNTNIPISPLTEVPCQGPPPEEEVDAVTGKKDRRIIYCFQIVKEVRNIQLNIVNLKLLAAEITNWYEQ